MKTKAIDLRKKTFPQFTDKEYHARTNFDNFFTGLDPRKVPMRDAVEAYNKAERVSAEEVERIVGNYNLGMLTSIEFRSQILDEIVRTDTRLTRLLEYWCEANLVSYESFTRAAEMLR